MAMRYVNYRRRAQNRHGVHSPFVYELIEKVFKPRDCQNREAIKSLRKELLRDHSEILIKDLGAGSRIDNGASRKVSKLVKVSATPMKQAALLQRLVDFLGCKSILELGTNLGITTAVLASAKSKPHVVSIEGAPKLAERAVKNLEKLNLNVEIISGSFEDKLALALSNLKKVDMAYIDGNHQKEATLSYFKEISEKIHNDSVVVVGDIHWSEGMEEAWEEIKKLSQVRVTIDIFDVGLVFFRREMTPEHFTIYY